MTCVCGKPSKDEYGRVESMFDWRGQSRRSALPLWPAMAVRGQCDWGVIAKKVHTTDMFVFRAGTKDSKV